MKLNGSLIFDASSASEIQNMRVQKYANYAAVPAYTSADVGRLVFVTSTATLYFGSGVASNWVTVATGGDATALQTEVNNIETSLGALVNSSGVFQVGAVTGPAFSGTEADVKELLQALSNYANANNTLAELDDVALVSAANKDFLMHNGTKWVDHVLVAADLTDVTSTAAELNILDGATLTVTELNYVDGVTSGIQDQLDNKQALDAGLTALAAFNTNGIIVQTADDVFAGRSLTAPAAGIAITNPSGVGGNPTFALANDLSALEGLTGTGYSTRTGTDTWVNRTFAGTVGNIVVTNGDGVASNTDINLATVTDSGAGTFKKISTDTYGRVTGTQAVTTADITALVDATYVNVTGDSMSANLTLTGGATITGLPTPVGSTDAANKAYVDALASGLSWLDPVVLINFTGSSATPVGSPVLYDSYLIETGGATGAWSAFAVNDIVQCTNATGPVWTKVTAAAVGQHYIISGITETTPIGIAAGHMTDFLTITDATVGAVTASFFDPIEGNAVFIGDPGAALFGRSYTYVADTNAPVGNPTHNWVQFGGPGSTGAGVGLSYAGSTLNINLGAGIAALPADEVGVDLYNTTTGAIILTDDGLTRAASPATNSKLHLLLDLTSTGGLEQGASGLNIKAVGVTNAMLVNDGVLTNADSGSGSLDLGQTLQVIGSATQGINTTATGQTITISAVNASTSQKGVASFSSADFSVTAGVVSITSLSNAQLDNSTITVTGTSGSDAFALGESVAVVGGAGGEVSTAVTANQVAISVRDATASLKGVASFAAADFTVTAGDVTMVAKALDSLTDVAISSVAAGQTLVYNGTNFVNRKVFHTEAFSSSTTWTVSHGLGQKFCNVTVIDASDEMVIPQSVTFDSATQLTVTFNTAIAGQVAVSGVNAGA